MAVDKFRPLLSASDIEWLLEGLALLTPNPQIKAIHSKLSVCLMKVNAGLVKPSARVAEESTGKNSLENDLGISEEEKAVAMDASLRMQLGEAPANEEEITAIKLEVRTRLGIKASPAPVSNSTAASKPSFLDYVEPVVASSNSD